MSFDLPQMWQAWPSSRTTHQQPSPVLQQSIPFQMVQVMGCPANIMPMFWCRNGNPIMLPFQLYGLQLSMLPVPQPMDQHRLKNQRASSAGPSRDRGQRRRQRKTETPYSNHITHISSAGTGRDPCTGVTQPRRMGAINGTGTGWAGRSPSRVLSSMPDRRCQAMRRNRSDKDRSSFSLGSHRGRFRDGDPSQYEIRIDESEEFDSHQYQVAGNSPALSTAGPLSIAPPTPTPDVSDMTTGTVAPSITEEQLDEEEQDFDGISLGSEPSEYQY